MATSNARVVRMRPRQCAVAGVYDGLYRSRLVDDHKAPGRLRDVGRGHRFGKRTRPPVAERALHPGESLFGRDVSDDGKHGIVRQVVRAMERDQVAARDGTDRPRRAALRQAVGMEAVHEPVEDHVGDVGRIVVADPQAGQDLVALPLDLRLRKGRPSRHVGEQVEREVEAVLHHEDVDEPEVARRAHAQRAADAVDGAGKSPGRSALSSPGREAARRTRRRPGWPGGSAAAPARRIMRTLTAGCS